MPHTARIGTSRPEKERMSRIAYVNGRYLPQREASVNIEDRGYQFGDGIYEVVHLYQNRFIDEDLHLARLERSLREIELPMPMTRPALVHVLHEVARRNRVSDGLLYMQVTRGVARRDHAFPARPVPQVCGRCRRARSARPAGQIPYAARFRGGERPVRRASAGASTVVLAPPDRAWRAGSEFDSRVRSFE